MGGDDSGWGWGHSTCLPIWWRGRIPSSLHPSPLPFPLLGRMPSLPKSVMEGDDGDSDDDDDGE